MTITHMCVIDIGPESLSNFLTQLYSEGSVSEETT
jgi:hypothetical protein